MTAQEVNEIVRSQAADKSSVTNDHGISLSQALVPPQRISMLVQIVKRGRVREQKEEVWLVGQENPGDGYKIVMRDDGMQFGLASNSFPGSKHLTLCGWYGGLISTFLSM